MPDPTTEQNSKAPPREPVVREHLTRDDVTKVAHLAMLELTEAELEVFTGQLDAVLDLAGQLEQFVGDHVPPTSHPFGLTNVLRPDVAADSVIDANVRAEALSGGPDVEDGRFKVPPALGEAP